MTTQIMAGPIKRVVAYAHFTPVCNHISNLVVSAAQEITPGLLGCPQQAPKVLLQTTGQNIRYTLDGTTPTAAIGFQLKSTDPPLLVNIVGHVVLTVIEETANALVELQFGI
jgi:hypothetical protein